MKRFLHLILFLPALLLSSCKSDKVKAKFITEYIVIIVIDGPRYSETWGEPSHSFIPYQHNLSSQGVLYTNFLNEGITSTVPGHTAITTAFYQDINNNGQELPTYPSFFQHWIKSYGKSTEDAWIITSKDKLEVLANCSVLGWNDKYMPSTDCGISGLGSGYREDSVTYQNSIEILSTYHPNLTLINFKEPDFSAHQSNWIAYLDGILKTDEYVQLIWDFIENDPFYQGKTSLFVTNDHGRHLDGISGGYAGHGDACFGCRKISLLALGPDFKEGFETNELHSQIDIPITIAKIMGLNPMNSEGKVLNELFK